MMSEEMGLLADKLIQLALLVVANTIRMRVIRVMVVTETSLQLKILQTRHSSLEVAMFTIHSH